MEENDLPIVCHIGIFFTFRTGLSLMKVYEVLNEIQNS